MGENILVLDCDGVIFDSIPLIDEYVQQIEYKASDKYKKEDLDVSEQRARDRLNKWEEERSNNPNIYGLMKKRLKDIEKARKLHYEYKDRVLEEADAEYVDRIDYDSVFILKNTFPGVVNMLYTIDVKGLFSEIYILSHVNCEREINAKQRFFKQYLPMVKFIPVMFHSEPFYNQDGSKNLKRVRTNKMAYFKDLLHLEDLSSVYFVDDTESIICEAEDLGVINTYYKNGDDSTIDILTKASFDSMGVVNAFGKNNK